MQRWALALTVASLALLTVVIFFVVRPPVYDVESNKDGVLNLFLEVPATVVRKFHRHTSVRLMRLREDAEDFADEKVANLDDLGEDDSADEKIASSSVAAGSERTQPTRANTTAQIDLQHRKKQEKDKTCRVNLQRHVTMFKILAYLAAALIYFLATCALLLFDSITSIFLSNWSSFSACLPAHRLCRISKYSRPPDFQRPRSFLLGPATHLCPFARL